LKRYQRFAGPAVLVIAIGTAYYFYSNSKPSVPPGKTGWEDLNLCFELTSIDSRKTLLLDEDFSATLNDDRGNKLAVGRWSLTNAEQHIYRIDTPGAAGAYVLVSPPDSEGCLLAAIEGTANDANLRRSWFSKDEDTDQ
jgi:hypothetical protein